MSRNAPRGEVPPVAEALGRDRLQQVDVGEPNRVRPAVQRPPHVRAGQREHRHDREQPPRLQEADHRVVPLVRACRWAATNRTMSNSQSESVRSRRCEPLAAADRGGDRGPLCGGGIGIAARSFGSAVWISCSAAGLRVDELHHPASSSSISRGSTTSMASTSWRTPSLRSGCAHCSAGHQEVGDHHGQAAPARRPVQRVDSAPRSARPGGGRSYRRSRAAGPASPCGRAAPATGAAGRAGADDRADPVAAPHGQVGHRGGGRNRQVALRRSRGAEVQARRQVDGEPGLQLAVGDGLADVRHGGPRGHRPVHPAYVVAGPIFARLPRLGARAGQQAE